MPAAAVPPSTFRVALSGDQVSVELPNARTLTFSTRSNVADEPPATRVMAFTLDVVSTTKPVLLAIEGSARESCAFCSVCFDPVLNVLRETETVRLLRDKSAG